MTCIMTKRDTFVLISSVTCDAGGSTLDLGLISTERKRPSRWDAGTGGEQRSGSSQAVLADVSTDAACTWTRIEGVCFRVQDFMV